MLPAIGCGEPGTEPAPAEASSAEPMIVEDVSFDLARIADHQRVPLEVEEHPVRIGSVRPIEGNQLDGSAQPTLLMAPPAKVVVTLPRTGPQALLRLATGLGKAEYVDGRASVRFVAELDGERVVDDVRRPQQTTALRRRVWNRFELPINGRRQLLLMTQVVGAGVAPTAVGFAGVEVVQRHELERTRADAEHPNVVLICIDTLRADRLSCYGYERETSPAIDALAQRGTVFDRAYASSSWTWPSTASLLTALTPPEHGLENVGSSYLAAELVTLAEAFQASGVTTGAFSTNPLVGDARGFGQGFESFVEFDWVPARRVVPPVTEWLEQNADVRFFLYVHLTDPHHPYEPEDDLARRFAGQVPDVDSDGFLTFAARRLTGDVTAAEEAHHRMRSDWYDGEVATVDRWLGRVFDRLDELGLADTTIVCVTSDHGEEFLEHGMLGHGKQLFDESVCVPLIFAGPGIGAGARVAEPVENRYVASTLLSLARLPRRGLAGVNLFAADARGGERSGTPVFFTTQRGLWIEGDQILKAPSLHGVEVGGHRLIWSPETGPAKLDRAGLYELGADPRMLRDASSEQPDRTEAMKQLVATWLEDGHARRPNTLDGGTATLEMLQALGYLDGD